MKQVYLAASWSRRDEVRELAVELENINVHVKSSWLYEGGPHRPELHDKHCVEMGYTDIREIYECDVFVRLSDKHLLAEPMVPSNLATCARMFEQGLAYGLGKVIYVVGGKQMLFDYMPRVTHVQDKLELMSALCPQTQ